MTFPAYPNYKSTGVEWLSEIPVHWELIRLRFLLLDGAEGIKIGPFGSQLTSDMLVEIGYKVYGQENVIAGDFDKGQRYITDEKFSEMSVYEISPNDLLVTMMGTAGRCKVVPEAISAGVMDSHLLRMRFGRKADPKFVELLIDKSIYVSHQVRLNGKGSIMHGLNSSIIKELLVALPSADEQASILSFLDHEIARIDALIEEQQRLIELLKEKRQAVISHAVTKGLDPTVPMKDSGVEWLGEVPAHWIISQLKFNTTEMQTGPFGSQLHAEDYIDGGIPLINPAHMVDGRIIPDFQVSVDEETWSRLSRHALKAGEIIFARRGELGRCAVVSKDQEGWLCGTGSLKASLNSRLSSEYAYLLVTSKGVVSELSLESKGSTMENLNTETLGRVRLPLPPLSEQEAILEHVHEISGQFAALINEAEDGIKLITERRSALISATVTGKIDVRGWQAPASTQAPKLEVAEAV